MLSVGLTGGIGGGKSTVAKILETLGVPVYYADAAAKRLMNSDPSIREAIISAFGNESYEGEQINRSFLLSQVVHDDVKLARLNSIVHPATIADSERWLREQSAPYAVKEAAIIFESGTQKSFDYVIGVTAPIEVRIERIMKRDGRTREQVLQLMARQMDEQKKMELCDFVIHNDGKQMVIPQTLALHKKLLELSASDNRPPARYRSSGSHG